MLKTGQVGGEVTAHTHVRTHATNCYIIYSTNNPNFGAQNQLLSGETIWSLPVGGRMQGRRRRGGKEAGKEAAWGEGGGEGGQRRGGR